MANGRALTYGSLAGRSPYNLDQLDHLLAVKGPRKFFDVNLRPPFVDPELVMELAKHADVIKLNDGELGRLAAWVRTGEMKEGMPRTRDEVSRACRVLAEKTGVPCICVTMGEAGAGLWDADDFVTAPTPSVVVKDTVGAGDGFMAGLMVGLTRGMEKRKVLENACRLGAFVASHDGATPLLPPEFRTSFETK